LWIDIWIGANFDNIAAFCSIAFIRASSAFFIGSPLFLLVLLFHLAETLCRSIAFCLGAVQAHKSISLCIFRLPFHEFVGDSHS